MFATGASEASGTKYNGTNTYQYQTLITICKSQNLPSGKPHNQMLLGPKDQEENKITGKGKALV